MRASTSAEKSDGPGAGPGAATTASSFSAAHSSGKLGGTTSWAAALKAAAAATHNARTTRRSVLRDREGVLLLELGIERLVSIAGAGNPYNFLAVVTGGAPRRARRTEHQHEMCRAF